MDPIVWTCGASSGARLTPDRRQFAVTVTGGPTTVIDVAGRRLLCDPTFDPPHDYGYLVKTEGPAVEIGVVGDVDAVLLSHDLHPDNFDESGREFALSAPIVLAPTTAATRLGPPVQGRGVWETWDLHGMTITAVPARHGPADGELNDEGFVNCEVTGFVIEAPGSPKTYVSGDNASLALVRDIYNRFGPMDCAVLFAGAASVPSKFDGRPLSLTSERAVAAAEILDAQHVIVAHQDGWRHFAQNAGDTRHAFAGAGWQTGCAPHLSVICAN
ncbi:MBL fold metallo-hydrolase [Blastococcus sp. PRF04-17]|uniref:MBL fold metallo-hydrolase n=1 Tax=Blastococcus sp. PRF04-17 TaxID=2933797 RepID=UPI001FF15548|nr:MBL fold metallo-hydrolase [Blastococcus sp. PRF04-17]UOY03361.1 MBL fold metallo-hydrolase [Blastococcus sp. PRF04-17]